jgi:hypothetical protein
VLGVHDAQGSQLFSIVGPCLYCDGPCCDVTFEVRHPDVRGEAVGELRRHGETLTPAQVRARPLRPRVFPAWLGSAYVAWCSWSRL